MPWYTTADALRDADKQRRLRECDVHAGCWKCGIGRFHLMIGSDHLWQCNKCGHVGRLKVIPQSRDTKEECSSLCADGYWCVVCGRHIPADENGVIVHDDVPHPEEMTFDEERQPDTY